MRRFSRSFGLTGSAAMTATSCGFATTMALYGKVVPFKLADIGEGILKVHVTEWYVKDGQKVEPFDSLCEVESDKAVTSIPSPYSGTIRKLYMEKGAEAYVGKPLVDIEVDGDVPAEAKKEEAPAAAPAAATPAATPAAAPAATPAAKPADNTVNNGKVLAAPATRRIAKENNINIANVPGTGKDGRVMKGDILAFIDNGFKAPAAAAAAATGGAAFRAPTEDKVIPLTTGVRKAMVKSMTLANEIPSFGACDEIEISELIKVRAALKKVVEGRNKELKLSFMPFFIKAASLALTQYPDINAHTDEKCENLIVKGSHNIGFAFDTPKGLIVPNVKDCQAKSIFEITEDLCALIDRGNKGQLGVQDMQGTTFTLSNIGSIGATYAKPVINPPQVAIGAIGRNQKLPRFDEKGNVFAANVINVSWSADHRVVDGASMVRFGNLFKSYLENPTGMLLDTR